LILILTMPNVWDTLVDRHGEAFAADLEKILAHDSKDFFRSITALPWDQQTGQRICSDITLDWLFNLTCMRTLGFIQPQDPSFGANGGLYLTNLINFNDGYVIEKLYAANKSPDFVLFNGLTKIGNYTGIEHAIVPLLTHPDFHIEIYYPQASEQFKQLPQVKTAIQLHDFLRSEDASASIDSDFFPEIFFHDLKTRYVDDVKTMTQQLDLIINKESVLDSLAQNQRIQKALELHEKIKKLPFENKQTLNQDLRIVAFEFAYRILANKEVDEPTQTGHQNFGLGLFTAIGRGVKKAATQVAKGHSIVGKEVKTPFLGYILRYLLNPEEYSSPEPFIWGAYVNYIYYKRNKSQEKIRSEEIKYSPKKMELVNTWLNEQVIEKPNVKETETIALLPEAIRNFIFAGTTLRHVHLETLNAELLAREADETSSADIGTSSSAGGGSASNPLLIELRSNSLFVERQHIHNAPSAGGGPGIGNV